MILTLVLLSPCRGLAHVGMIKAMQEAGIPIDMVGGTSMGAFIGALWAEERQFPKFNIRAKEWSIVSSCRVQLSDGIPAQGKCRF